MNKKMLAVLLTLGIGIPAFALSRVIWPDPPGMPAPPPGLVPFLLVPAVFEALAFGAGVAFLVFGRRFLQRAGEAPGLTLAAYVAIAWSLLNWWPHVNFHRSIGFNNLVALVVVDWAFHLTLIASAVVIAIFFIRVLSASREREQAIAA